MTVYLRLMTILCLFWLLPVAAAETAPLSIEMVAEQETVQPGKPFWIALHFQSKDDWHVYGQNPGDIGIPLTIAWSLPAGFQSISVEWPTPERFGLEDMIGYGYEGSFTLLAQMTSSPSVDLNKIIDINADISWLACSSTTCLPGKKHSTIKVKTGTPASAPNPQWSALFAEARQRLSQQNDLPSQEFEGGLALALLFAFLGGIILNLMPCVLPIISFKIMGFVKMAGENRALILKHGLLFSLGVIVSFWFLAGMMLILQAYGQSVGWGFQLQEPLFVGFLAALLLMVGLNMFGVFEAGLGVASWAGEKQHTGSQESSSFSSSFLSGVLATAVATPCTGPFLGSAIGFAFTLPALYALLIFTVLGLGMASPYLLLSAFPSCLRYMPKPGAWMVTFKEFVGFVMMATVLWLVWIFGAQTSNVALVVLLFAFLFIAIACWIYGKWSLPTTSRIARTVAYASALLFLGLGALAITTAASSADSHAHNTAQMTGQGGSIHQWETFSPERVAELQKQGIPVLVDFTAKWCLICQANHLILSQDKVSNKLADNGVVKMKADWTKNDPVITQELRKFGRNGVPLYVLYGPNPGEQPKILPQVLTADIMSDHLDAIADNSR